uniref:Beta-amyrin 11-oxidase-like n=1 Tax=Cucumis melo TaxID=3656 RepID=A0A9I9E8S1_CUCME
MEMISVCVIIGVVLGVSLLVFRRLNELWYLVKSGGRAYKSLPPGDLGWPVIGSSFSSYKTFVVQEDPISFIQSLHSRYGKGGIYKTHLYGKPTVIATDPEICRRIYLDEAKFKQHYPKSVKILEGSSGEFSKMDHKIAYKVMAAPMNGSEVLSNYVDFIEEVIAKGLEEWSSMMRDPIKLLEEIGNLFFKVIIKVFLGSQLDAKTMVELHTLYKEMSFGVEEQESIIRQRPSNQKGLTLNEIKQMKYLSKKYIAALTNLGNDAGANEVINEVLRRNTITPTNFRETKTDVNINGYFIPKGW